MISRLLRVLCWFLSSIKLSFSIFFLSFIYVSLWFLIKISPHSFWYLSQQRRWLCQWRSSKRQRLDLCHILSRLLVFDPLVGNFPGYAVMSLWWAAFWRVLKACCSLGNQIFLAVLAWRLYFSILILGFLALVPYHMYSLFKAAVRKV